VKCTVGVDSKKIKLIRTRPIERGGHLKFSDIIIGWFM
jgi:hypothetical protein